MAEAHGEQIRLYKLLGKVDKVGAWLKSKGYAVPEHLEALHRLGPTVHHRRFFAPVVAAREKHFPETVERDPDLFAEETQVSIEATAA